MSFPRVAERIVMSGYETERKRTRSGKKIKRRGNGHEAERRLSGNSLETERTWKETEPE